uniref:ZP domain-containing protein n=1 Tax=Parastrongyloides trichosuri TaxID=131310 RepID=A0A0N4Z9H0_PARTI
MNTILLLLLLLIPFLITSKEQDRFWIVGEILSVQWKRGCLSAERCTNPRFQIVSQQLDVEEIQRVDFPLHVTSTRNVGFNNYFSNGNPESLIISIKIVGIDPLYNIPLDCDKTSNVRAFSTPVVNHSLSPEGSPSVIEFEGKCFTAIIQLKKYDTICPWCSESKSLDNIDDTVIPDNLALGQVQINQKVFIIIMGIFLSVISLSSIFLLFLYIKQKKEIKRRRNEICRYPQIPSTKIKIGIPSDDGYETIYDKEKSTSVSIQRNSFYSSGYPSSQNSATSILSHNNTPIDISSNFI